MNIVLLSGGSGKRLWPLSNDVRSKQFIKIFRRTDGVYESMLQRMARQIRAVDPDAVLTIAAPKTQLSAIRSQLGGEIGISVEPSRRDTFPAIALAAAYLHDVVGVDGEEPIVVCPVDPYVEEDYFRALKELAAQAGKGEANLVLMGIEPTYPSEKYGYILPSSLTELTFVDAFREKPDVAAARSYIARGALWNGGIFAFRLQYALAQTKKHVGFSDYRTLYERYDTLPKTSFDYAVVEREPHIQVMRYGGPWMDLGTWNTLTEAMDEGIVGDGRMDETCHNVHILNELPVPVLAMGLRDVIISASPEGILVSDKERSSYMKPFVDSLDRPVMFAEKTWGDYRVLDAENGSMTVKVTLHPGHRMQYHSHRRRDEVWVVTAGEGTAIVDGAERPVRPGDVVTMRAGSRHTILAQTELKLVEVQIGEGIEARDKQKFPWGNGG